MYFLGCQTPPRIKKIVTTRMTIYTFFGVSRDGKLKQTSLSSLQGGVFRIRKWFFPQKLPSQRTCLLACAPIFWYPFVQVLLKWYGPHGKVTSSWEECVLMDCNLFLEGYIPENYHDIGKSPFSRGNTSSFKVDFPASHVSVLGG